MSREQVSFPNNLLASRLCGGSEFTMAKQYFGGNTNATLVVVGLASLGLGVVMGATGAVVYGATAVTDAGAKRQSTGLAARAARLAKAETKAEAEVKAEVEETKAAKADAANAAKAAKA